MKDTAIMLSDLGYEIVFGTWLHASGNSGDRFADVGRYFSSIRDKYKRANAIFDFADSNGLFTSSRDRDAWLERGWLLRIKGGYSNEGIEIFQTKGRAAAEAEALQWLRDNWDTCGECGEVLNAQGECIHEATHAVA